jgi:hypothetical protein
VDKITLITYPDYYHNLSDKVLFVNTTADERNAINDWLLNNPKEITLYLYNNENHIEWLLNVANQVNSIYLNIDNSTDLSYYYISYLVALTKTTWSGQIDYSILNKGRVRDINEYIQRNWLA